MEIELKDLKGGSAKDRERYLKAIEIAKKVINSQPFKARVLGFKYLHNGTIVDGFKHNRGLTNQQIYVLFRSGWDKFNTEKDGDIDLSVTLYRNRWSGTKGYTYGNTAKIWVNTYFFRGSEDKIIASIVGNLIHEALHNLEFDHAYRNNSTRKFTVPYAYGDIAYELALDYFSVDQSETVWVCRRFWFFWTRCKWEEKS